MAELRESFDIETLRDRVRTADSDNMSASLPWDARIGVLIDQWTALSAAHQEISLPEFAETSARIMWSISKVLTTYSPLSQHSSVWRRARVPEGRVVSIRLAERARSLLVKYLAHGDSRTEGLKIATTQTVSVQYRSSGFTRRALGQYRRHAQSLLVEEAAPGVIENASERAYLLSGHCIDLATLKRTDARERIAVALRWARGSGEHHSVADTIVRAAEVELRLGDPAGCLDIFGHHSADGRAWDVVKGAQPIVRAIAHKVRMQAYAELECWSDAEGDLKTALALAAQEKLEDQRRKVVELSQSVFR